MHCTDSDPAANQLCPIGQRGFRPLNDRVLVRRTEAPSPGLLAIPEIAQRLSKRGVVVACGPGKRSSDGHRRPLDVKPGDLIEFGRFTDFDDGDLLLITEADIVFIVQGDGT